MQVDPTIMDSQLGIVRGRFAHPSDVRPEEPTITDDEIQRLLEEDDGPIFPGGPNESLVSSWKKQFEDVYLTEITGQGFIWRTLKRLEYKQIVSIPNTDPLIREEMICETCVLFPFEYDVIDMGGDKAGIPSMLSEQIMEKSGFTRMILPQKL